MNQQKPDGHPGARKLTDSMSHQLGVTARRVARLFSAQYVKQCKVKPTEWRALAVIAGQGTATPSAISAESHMDKVDVSRAVAGLVNRGLVKRASDAHDGRVFQLSLTRKGEAAHAAAQSLTSKMEAVLADGMSKADFAALWKGLKLLEEQASKLAAELDASGA